MDNDHDHVEDQQRNSNSGIQGSSSSANQVIASCGIDVTSPNSDHQVIASRGIEVTSPNSGRKSYIPDVDDQLKPIVGRTFDTIDHAYVFYQTYARAGGFEVRKGAQYSNSKGVKKLKYFYCSKEGYSKPKKIDTLNETEKQKVHRLNSSKRTGCKAHIRMDFSDSKWKVYKFLEEHNHAFVDERDMHFLTSSRHLTHLQKHMIHSMSKINLGPVKAFNVMRTMFGGFEEVGVSKEDCKNFKREINLFIGEYDAEMAVNFLLQKKEHLPNFSCYYFLGDEDRLKGLFWADQEAKRNYYTFGDVVSFDATYRSNKYSMVFVPFTGIDNHFNNVTFGAALLGSETAETYKWLLNCFLKAFGKEPQVIVTDQDPAMKKAIAEVFVNSRHRLCMWHVMYKLSLKVGAYLCNSTDFKQKICNVVWTDALTPEEFEEGWAAVINEFELSENNWLHDIFCLRESWIPAYYRNEFLSGLMRTTSRSESENHFFGQVFNPKLTLVEFLTNYETAIEAQRHTHRKNDHDTRYTDPNLKTEWVLEKQAARIYTKTIFHDVQGEIVGLNDCINAKFEEMGQTVKFFIIDFKQPCSSFFEVLFCKEEGTISCSCRRYEQFGLLCRHVFYVLKTCDIREFPKKYILRRWTRDVVPNTSFRDVLSRGICLDGNNEVQALMRDILFATEYTLNRLSDNLAELSIYKDHVEGYMKKADDTQIVAPPSSKRDRVAEILGHNQNDKRPVRVPINYKSKGSGSQKRMKSKQEEAIVEAGKKQRQCQNCKEYGHYASTCKVNPKKKDGEGSSRDTRSTRPK